jgi:hypothetical protein
MLDDRWAEDRAAHVDIATILAEWFIYLRTVLSRQDSVANLVFICFLFSAYAFGSMKDVDFPGQVNN